MKHPRHFDITIAALVAKLPQRFEPAMRFISNIGGFWFAAPVLAILIFSAMHAGNHHLLVNLMALLVLTPLAELAKFITRRKRPETLYVEQMRFKTYSFPSGHAYISSLIAGYISMLALSALVLPLGAIIATIFVCFALLVGLSRVYLGAHFPSDVLGGWVLSMLMLIIFFNLKGLPV